MPKKSHTISGNKRFMTKRAIPILKKYGIKNVKAAERGGFFLELTFDIDDAKLQKLDKELKKANKKAYGGVLEQIRKIIKEEIQVQTNQYGHGYTKVWRLDYLKLKKKVDWWKLT